MQAKNSRFPVGNDAVQEVLGGMCYYNCMKAIVATTSEFTPSARELALTNPDVSLWDVRKLQELWVEYVQR